jgi:hypothetical protein
MKALTLWQPWASLVAFGEKEVETRCWTTKYRGPLAIHAAAKEPPDWLGMSRHRQEFCRATIRISTCHQWGEGYWPNAQHSVALGAVLCIARLVAIDTVESAREDLSAQELLFGNYEDGRYAWFLQVIERFEMPLAAKGNRRLWNWDETAHGYRADRWAA